MLINYLSSSEVNGENVNNDSPVVYCCTQLIYSSHKPTHALARHCLLIDISLILLPLPAKQKVVSPALWTPAPYQSGYAGISSDFGSVKAASDRGSQGSKEKKGTRMAWTLRKRRGKSVDQNLG